MPDMQPLTIWGLYFSPNPFKVILILAELGIPFKLESTSTAVVKSPEYTKLNPNGRTPTIYDPNTDTTLWESGAIITYLIDTYDHEHRISFPRASKEYYLANQWLFFQTSGQGPYFGQWYWFTTRHPEKIPSAIDRYSGEMRRILGVLNKWLAGGDDGGDGKGPRQFLLGDKCSYADLSFVPWNLYAPCMALNVTPEELEKEFPYFSAWMERMKARPAVAAMIEKRKAEIESAK
ncbi:glutathione S- transferase, nitrogen catabolite repression regulator [Myotisia sp. PD_48]|nr:glutathione S- transferase, nitrogen catabolite repression regulator [Myotisia sp. PD_48]